MSAHFRSRRSPARLKSSKLFGLAVAFALLAALLYAVALAVPAGARRQAGPTPSELAARLLKFDPGRLIGGDTIVGVSNGDVLLGVPNRVNFMVALGSSETIVGGNKADQLGAILGKNATISGRAGNDLIHGGAGHDTLFGGAGNDLITDTKGTATINTGGGKNEVEVAGHPGRDRVFCAPGSVDRIFANHGDYIAPSCRKAAGSQVVYHRPAPTAAESARVSANGCTDNPHESCWFEARSGRLDVWPHWWSWAKIPETHCPPSHPYLINKDYVPFGMTVTQGIAVSNVPNVDYFANRALGKDNYVIGNGSLSTVTDWTFHPQDWSMNFHCTRNKDEGYRHGG
jgi:Ca2+-binding RTX toxin-like protein